MRGANDERKSDPASLKSAQVHYKNAIRMAPGYALTYTRLGSIYLSLSGYAGASQVAELEQASDNLRKAVSLDPQLPVANAGLALVNYLLGWDWSGAEAGFQRALELGSTSATHQSYAWALITRGRFAESERHFEEDIQLDPLSCLPHYNLRGCIASNGGARRRGRNCKHASNVSPTRSSAAWSSDISRCMILVPPMV